MMPSTSSALHGRAVLIGVDGDRTVEDGHELRTRDIREHGQAAAAHAAHDVRAEQRRNVAAGPVRDVRGVSIAVQHGRAGGLDAQRTRQHDHRAGAANGLVGTHRAVGVAVQDAGRRAAVDGVIVPRVGEVVAEARVIGGGQAQQLRQNGGQLRARQIAVGRERIARALHDAGVRPALDRAFSPVVVCVGVARCQNRHRQQRRDQKQRDDGG